MLQCFIQDIWIYISQRCMIFNLSSLICLYLVWKYVRLICKTGLWRTRLPSPPNSSCCKISDAIICIYRLITLSNNPLKHVHYKCQWYFCAVVSSHGRDYLIYKMAKNVITRLHWCWLHQTELYKLIICFSTFYLKTSWLTAILAFLSLSNG